MKTRSHLLAYSMGSAVGLIVGTLLGGPVVDELRIVHRARRAK